MRDEKGQFVKENTSWIKGKHHSKESILKMSESHKGSIPWIKGKHHTEESKKKMSLSATGQPAHNWKGGKTNHRGYVSVWINGAYILEHRFVMEQYLDRKLYSWETVHHINGIRDDNKIENLKLLPGVEHNTKVQKVYQDNEVLKLRIKELESELQLLAIC